MEEVLKRIDKLEQDAGRIFKVVFDRIDNLGVETPALPSKRNKIGLSFKP